MSKHVLGVLAVAAALGAGAADGVWIGGEGRWTDPANWKDGVVPNGAADTATFNGRTPAIAHLDANVALNRLVSRGANHQVTSNGTVVAAITFHPDADGAAEVHVDAGCGVDVAAHAYANANGTVDLLKTGGGRITFVKSYMNSREYRSVDVKEGVWEHAKDMASGDYLRVTTVHVRKGATWRSVSPNNVCNWAVFDLEEGATLDFNGQTDLVGSLRGAGRRAAAAPPVQRRGRQHLHGRHVDQGRGRAHRQQPRVRLGRRVGDRQRVGERPDQDLLDGRHAGEQPPPLGRRPHRHRDSLPLTHAAASRGQSGPFST